MEDPEEASPADGDDAAGTSADSADRESTDDQPREAPESDAPSADADAGDGADDAATPEGDDDASDGMPSPGTDEYDEWIQSLRDANPDPVAEPDVSTEAPEDGIGGGAVAGPMAAVDDEDDATTTESDADADPEATPTGEEEDGPLAPPATRDTDREAADHDDATLDTASPSPAEPTAASGETTAVGDAVGSEPAGVPGPGDPGFGGPGEPAAPPDDEEMPLSEHIEEMVRRLAVVVIAAALATALAFPSAESLLNAMWYGVLPPKVPSPTLYGPLEKLLSEIKVASLAGILIALPVLVYESYLFMRPGLYPKERRYFLAAVPTSLVLGSIGMAFAYFVILPVLFQYFITYSESAVDALPFGLQVTFDLIVSLLGAFALVFQIPLLIMLAVMIGVVTRRWLEEQRILFWGLFLGVGFFISLGDATGTAPIIIALTMISLFEGTLALLRWTGRN